MDTAKYVVIYERLGTLPNGKFVDSEIIYVFPPNIIHRDFARNIAPQSRWRGAGFVGRQANGKHYCYGKSVSMEVCSRNEDNELLSILLGE